MVQITLISGLLPILATASAQIPSQNATSFSASGLQSLNAAMAKWVDTGKGANIVTLLSHRGKIVNHDAYGVLDASAAIKTPARKDTIYRIMSMTKPVVGVAMMFFYEQGKWKLDDPVSKHIPEFKGLKVVASDNSAVDQKTEMTMAQLMSHSAGFPAMLTVNSTTLDEIIPPLVRGQLAFQPGTDWRYGPGVEIQGYLSQKWAGKDLSDYLEEKLFRPLGMVDTGFFIDPSKAGRVSKLHVGFDGKLASKAAATATSKPKRLSPSGGLLSTALDYWKFSQMLLYGGSAGGQQYLKPETVALMHKNVLAPGVRVGLAAGGASASLGFGLDFAVVLADSPNSPPKDSYYWGGAYGTLFWIDPANDVVFVGMIQNRATLIAGAGGDLSLRQIAAREVYAALKKY